MLRGKQRRYLRGLGQRLTATLHVGRDGVTGAVVEQAQTQLAAHELIKVRVGEHAPASRHEIADMLATQTRAEVVQVLGRTALLYRERSEDPTIVLPT
ncbi:MAG TPA: YhbY family RNA-binding protein [Methylomirabilota bacterium]|jgi:RNA-binding protein